MIKKNKSHKRKLKINLVAFYRVLPVGRPRHRVSAQLARNRYDKPLFSQHVHTPSYHNSCSKHVRKHKC